MKQPGNTRSTLGLAVAAMVGSTAAISWSLWILLASGAD